jgi:hypothetical protein
MVSGEDDYTRSLETDRRQALWRAELSDGRVVVMDDGRPGVSPDSAWLRLAEEVRRTGVRIRRLWPQFRSNAQPTPSRPTPTGTSSASRPSGFGG